jgi:hypothetical protein
MPGLPAGILTSQPTHTHMTIGSVLRCFGALLNSPDPSMITEEQIKAIRREELDTTTANEPPTQPVRHQHQLGPPMAPPSLRQQLHHIPHSQQMPTPSHLSASPLQTIQTCSSNTTSTRPRFTRRVTNCSTPRGRSSYEMLRVSRRSDAPKPPSKRHSRSHSFQLPSLQSSPPPYPTQGTPPRTGAGYPQPERTSAAP